MAEVGANRKVVDLPDLEGFRGEAQVAGKERAERLQIIRVSPQGICGDIPLVLEVLQEIHNRFHATLHPPGCWLLVAGCWGASSRLATSNQQHAYVTLRRLRRRPTRWPNP